MADKDSFPNYPEALRPALANLHNAGYTPAAVDAFEKEAQEACWSMRGGEMLYTSLVMLDICEKLRGRDTN